MRAGNVADRINHREHDQSERQCDADSVIAPPKTWSMIIAPVPANTSANVPRISAKYFFIWI